MANHAYVKTRKKMTPQAITEMIDRLNRTVFKNCLKVEYHQNDPNDTSVWGPHVWHITIVYKGKEFCHGQGRVCWLNSEKFFEIRHGGGSNFLWWVDTVICNEVALIFNGTWTDDGSDQKDKGEPHKFDRFRAYLRRLCGHGFYYRNKGTEDGNDPFDAKRENLMMWWMMQQEEKCIPQPLRMKNWRILVKMMPAKGKGNQLFGERELRASINPKYAKAKKQLRSQTGRKT